MKDLSQYFCGKCGRKFCSTNTFIKCPCCGGASDNTVFTKVGGGMSITTAMAGYGLEGFSDEEFQRAMTQSWRQT